MKTLMTGLIAGLLLAATPLLAGSHCSCSEQCQKDCSQGKSEKCDCKTCDCKEGTCKHDKCSKK